MCASTSRMSARRCGSWRSSSTPTSWACRTASNISAAPSPTSKSTPASCSGPASRSSTGTRRSAVLADPCDEGSHSRELPIFRALPHAEGAVSGLGHQLLRGSCRTDHSEPGRLSCADRRRRHRLEPADSSRLPWYGGTVAELDPRSRQAECGTDRHPRSSLQRSSPGIRALARLGDLCQNSVAAHLTMINMAPDRAVDLLLSADLFDDATIRTEIDLQLVEMNRREASDGIDASVADIITSQAVWFQLLLSVNHPSRAVCPYLS